MTKYVQCKYYVRGGGVHQGAGQSVQGNNVNTYHWLIVSKIEIFFPSPWIFYHTTCPACSNLAHLILRNQRNAGRGQAWARAGTQWTMTWSVPLAVVEGERESLPTLRWAFQSGWACVVTGHPEHNNDCFDSWFYQLICLWIMIMSMWMIVVILIMRMTGNLL